MKLSFFIYTVLFLVMGIVIPHAYGQKETVDSFQLKPGVAAKGDALYFDALKAKMHDDDKKASELFLQFAILEPGVPSTYYELSKLSYNNKKLEDADEYIRKALILSPDNKWYKEQYATILADHDSFMEAASIMAELTKSEPDDRTYPLMAAEYYGQAHKYTEAISYLDLAITRDGPDEDILMKKVQLYLNMNDVEKAAGAMKEIIEQEPDNGRYYRLLGDLYDNNKLPAKAGEVYENALKAIPGDPFIQLGVAEHYLKLGDSASYRAYERKAITNTDFDVETQLDALNGYIRAMPTDSVIRVEGLPLIRQLVVQHPSDPQVLAFFGDFLDLANQHDSAAAAYKNSLAIKPGNFNAWESLLKEYSDPQDADSLVKYSEKAMRLFPNQAVVNYYNSIGHLNKKEYPAAIKAIKRAIDLQPDNNQQVMGSMYALLADIYHSAKQDDLSDSAFEKALQLEPNDPSVLNNYSYYLSERGVRLDKAEQMSKRSLEIRPGEATFLDTYGWILYKRGDYENAKKYVQEAIDHTISNVDATVYGHLGDIYYKLNDKDKAMQYWKMAKEKGADDPQLDKKIKEGKLYE